MDQKEALKTYIEDEILKGRNVKLSDDTDLLGEGILDSLGILQLVAFIDEKFGIQVPDEDVVYDNFSSLNALSTYLAGQQN